MKKYRLLFLLLISSPLYSQNFNLNIGYTRDRFNSINERKVSFNGINAGYSWYFYKRAGVYLGYTHYLPSTYYGIIKYWDMTYGIAPAYITGSADDIKAGLKLKLFDPGSKKLEINATVAGSYLIHNGKYNKEPFLRHYEGTFLPDIKNKVTSLYSGMEIIFRSFGMPFFISGGYNYVFGQEIPYDEWDGFSTPFSSSVELKIGISLPVMKGPVPSQIRTIEY